MDKKSNGFTLLELLMGVAILGIIMGIATPSFVELISNNRMSSGVHDFVGALQMAKAESAARVVPATVCKKNVAGSGCLASGDWQQGWIVFTDLNGNASVDAGDTVVLNHEALGTGITFDGTAGVGNAITYNPSGTTSITGTQVLIMCDARGYAESAMGILITITGRGNVMKATNTGQTTCL